MIGETISITASWKSWGGGGMGVVYKAEDSELFSTPAHSGRVPTQPMENGLPLVAATVKAM